MKKLIVFIALFSIGLNGYSCLNEYRENMQGDGIEWGSMIGMFYQDFHTEYCQAFVDRFDLEKKEEYEFKEMSDVSVHLAHLGRYEESLDILRWLIHEHPDDYKVVSNLGTLYELNGLNDSAHFYISKGITLNPESHKGSEWFHLSILEAKMEMEKDDQWIYNHRVLDLNLDYAVEMYSDIWMQIEDTLRHINHQLRERIPFTPTPDLILANVLTEFGDMLGPNFSIEDAYYAYEIATHYDPENHFDQRDKSEDMKFLMKDIEVNNTIGQIFRPEGDYSSEGDLEELLGSQGVDEDEDSSDSGAKKKEVQGKLMAYLLVIAGGLFTLIIIIRRSRNSKKTDSRN